MYPKILFSETAEQTKYLIQNYTIIINIFTTKMLMNRIVPLALFPC